MNKSRLAILDTFSVKSPKRLRDWTAESTCVNRSRQSWCALQNDAKNSNNLRNKILVLSLTLSLFFSSKKDDENSKNDYTWTTIKANETPRACSATGVQSTQKAMSFFGTIFVWSKDERKHSRNSFMFISQMKSNKLSINLWLPINQIITLNNKFVHYSYQAVSLNKLWHKKLDEFGTLVMDR